MTNESLNIVLPFCLFSVSVIIAFILHAIEKRNCKLSNLKKLMDRFAQQMQENSAKFTMEADALDQKLTDKMEDLKSYAEDFEKLSKAMHEYKYALDCLAKLTDDADANIKDLKQELESLEKTRAEFDKLRVESIDEFRKQYNEAFSEMKKGYSKLLADFHADEDKYSMNPHDDSEEIIFN